jgi:hypothetical protein
VAVVVVSGNLNQPIMCITDDIRSIVNATLQTVKHCLQEQLHSCCENVLNIEPGPSVNQTTLYGLLLGYPVVYWYTDTYHTGHNTCLSLVPMTVTKAKLVESSSHQHVIYSFTVPQFLHHQCQQLIEHWTKQLTAATCLHNAYSVLIYNEIALHSTVSM